MSLAVRRFLPLALCAWASRRGGKSLEERERPITIDDGDDEFGGSISRRPSARLSGSLVAVFPLHRPLPRQVSSPLPTISRGRRGPRSAARGSRSVPTSPVAARIRRWATVNFALLLGRHLDHAPLLRVGAMARRRGRWRENPGACPCARLGRACRPSAMRRVSDLVGVIYNAGEIDASEVLDFIAGPGPVPGKS